MSSSSELDELTHARMVIEAIDGTIAALEARQEPQWAQQIATLENLREQTIAAVGERHPEARAERRAPAGPAAALPGQA